jgi:hypothetical protein
MAQEQQNQEYNGPGKVASAATEGVTLAAIGAGLGEQWRRKGLVSDVEKLVPSVKTLEDVQKIVGKEEKGALLSNINKAAEKFEGRNKWVYGATAVLAAVGALHGVSRAADGKEQFEKNQRDMAELRSQNAETARQRDEAVGQLSHVARVLQDRASAGAAQSTHQPHTPSTAPVTAAMGMGAHKQSHDEQGVHAGHVAQQHHAAAAGHDVSATHHSAAHEAPVQHAATLSNASGHAHVSHAETLAAKGHRTHDTHTNAAVASKEHAAGNAGPAV